MKRSYIAGLAFVSLSLSSTAMAAPKAMDALDVFSGNFDSVATLNIKSLANNPLVANAVEEQKNLAGFINELKAMGIDYKNDIDMVAVAATDKGAVCSVIDGTAKIGPAVIKKSADEKTPNRVDNNVVIYTDSGVDYAVLSDSRVLFCDTKIDIKPSIANAFSAKPTTLKSSNKKLYDMYAMSKKNADIRVGGNLTSSLKAKYGSKSLDDGENRKIALSDADGAAVSVKLSNDGALSVEGKAKMKNAEKAQLGASVMNAKLTPLVSDPSWKDMNLGFIATCYKITSEKSNILVNIDLNKDQIGVLLALAGASIESAKPAKK